MIAILVKKAWIDEVANFAKGWVLYVHSESLRVAYAFKTSMEYPFVYAEIARENAEGVKSFVPVHIPVESIRGIFDVEEVTEKKLGF